MITADGKMGVVGGTGVLGETFLSIPELSRQACGSDFLNDLFTVVNSGGSEYVPSSVFER